MNPQNRNRIFVGAATLPFAGMLAILALLLRGPFSLPSSSNMPEWIKTVSASTYLLAQYGLIAAYVLPLFGMWAIYEYLSSHQRAERLAFLGMLGGIWGTALALPTLGITAYVNPIAGKAYTAGVTEVAQVITDAIMGPSLGVGIVSALLYTVGPLLSGLAIWRSGRLPKWTGVLFALHGILLSFGFSLYPLLLLGWALFTLSGAGIAWTIRPLSKSRQ